MTLATPIFRSDYEDRGRRLNNKMQLARSHLIAVVTGVGLLLGIDAGAQTKAPKPSPLRTEADFATYAKSNFWAAQARSKTNANEADGWKFAQACFDAGEFVTNSAERALFAEQGIKASREFLRQNRHSAPGHYYLGMNLGQLARTKGLGALKLVDEMEVEFKHARELDNTFDHGGPDRNLGLLYRDAPVIGSIGNRSKARQHLSRAAVLAPHYPENRLNLVESFLKWGDRTAAQREFKALEEIWPGARTNLAGPAWAAAWADWDKRERAVKLKMEEVSKTLETPRQKS